jgi:hypothetical protein
VEPNATSPNACASKAVARPAQPSQTFAIFYISSAKNFFLI